MKNIIEIKRRLGRHDTPLIDICDPEQAEAVRELTGCKTVVPRHIESLKKLGFEIYDCDKEIHNV